MSRFLFPIIAIILMFSIGGVQATWYYAEISPYDVASDVDIGLDEFDYHAEDILPGGDDQEAQLGENHMALIELILNENSKGYGLNISKKNILMEYLEDDGEVHCNQKVSGGHLKFILDVKNNTHGLYYVCQLVSDTLIYAYTFSTNELSTASGSSIEITVYRTELVKTDKWRAGMCYEGLALTKSMSSLGLSADSGSIRYSIDLSTWHTK